MIVGHAADLMDRGIKLYMAGRIREAREAFQLVVDLDPGNAKARSYLVLIRETVSAVAAPVAAMLEEHLAAPVATPAAPLVAPVAVPPPAAQVAPSPEAPAPRGGGTPPPEHPEEDYAPSPWDDGPAAPATIELDSSAGGLDLDAVAEKSDLRPLVPEGARSTGAEPKDDATGPKTDVEVWLSAAKELFALGDFSGSLELIEKILQLDPDHGEARDYLRQNEATLVSMYESKLGSLSGIPRLAIKPEEVMWLNLDHRAGFLLAQIDGTVDFESLFALSGLPRLDTARILANLIADGVITS